MSGFISTEITFFDGPDLANSTETGTLVIGSLPGREIEITDKDSNVAKYDINSLASLTEAVNSSLARVDGGLTGAYFDVGDTDVAGENDKRVGYAESQNEIHCDAKTDGAAWIGVEASRGLAAALATL